MDDIRKIIALVPMKGHSERVPDKNIRDFAGKPLYHCILETLLKSRYIKQVLIDTDSDWIKEDTPRHFDNIMVIDRPEELCGDFVSINNIIAYDISRVDCEHFLQTHSTNPLLTTQTIDRAIEMFLQREKHDCLFSATRLQERLYWEDGSPINHNPTKLLRTQDLPPVFQENSNIYLFSRESFSKHRRRIGERPMMFEISREEAVDIDDESDFHIAEMIMRERKKV